MPAAIRIVLICLIVQFVGNVQAEDWLRFRGPNGSGVSASSVPSEFGKDSNLKWQVDLPGRGVSSPIVVGDRVFVTCYSGYGESREEPGEIENLQRHLVCVDRVSGGIKWTATETAIMPEDPYSGMGVPAHGYASHTPTSDQENVYVFYGKSGVYAYDMEGKKLWHTMVGQDSGRQRWGSSSSPILHQDVLIVLASDESETLFGLDKNTGEEIWKSKAEGYGSVWGTPALAKGKNGTEVVVAVPEETWAVNAATGKFSWYAPGNGGGSHSIVIGDGVAYSIGGSRGGAAALAIELGKDGEIDDVVWESNASSRFATPVLFGDHVFAYDGRTIACLDAKSGEEVYQQRLPEAFKSSDADAGSEGEERGGRGRGRGRRGGFGRISYASPVVANGKLYVTETTGTIYVLAAKPEFEVLAKNDMSFDSSGFNATPAISDGQMFLRSHSALYCVGE